MRFPARSKSQLARMVMVLVLVGVLLFSFVGFARELVVTSIADSGTGTLRWALQTAQSGDVITFDPIVFPPDDPETILVHSGLPAVRCGNLTIDASNAGVTVNGSIARGSSVNGLEVFSSNNTIRGLRIEDFSECGIFLSDMARNNTIGGEADQGQGNTIVGCNGGIVIWGASVSYNAVLGNRIGTDGTMSDKLGNIDGVGLGGGARHNVIGPNNLIAHNQVIGVLIADMDSFTNTITQNSIHSNGWGGIRFGDGDSAAIKTVLDEADLTHGWLTGHTCANCKLEFFSGEGYQGRVFVGQTTADADGSFELIVSSIPPGSNLTVTATDQFGTTSGFVRLLRRFEETNAIQKGTRHSMITLTTKTTEDLESNRLGQLASLASDIHSAADVAGFVSQHVELGLSWYRLGLDWLDWCEVRYPSDLSSDIIDPNADITISMLHDRGVSVMLELVYWDRQTSIANPPNRLFSTADEIDEYGDYVGRVVSHFQGRVASYGLLNEPNVPNPGQFVEASDYIKLIRHVVPVIREQDPAAKVVIGEVTPLWDSDGFEYLSVILDSDILPLIDGIAWHWISASPEYQSEFYYNYPQLVRGIRETAASGGFSGELLAEEIVLRTSKTPHQSEYMGYEEIPALKYMTRVAIMNLGLGLATGFALESLDQLPSQASLIQAISTVMAGHESIDMPVGIDIETDGLIAYCAFRYTNGDRMLAVWTDGIAVDDDPGVPATISFPGLTAETVTGIDVLHGFEQELVFEVDGKDTIIRDLLVKDYPILIRLSDVTMGPDYEETLGDGFHRLGNVDTAPSSTSGGSDRDGDGVPDNKDYCPDWPGSKEANGC